MKKLRVIFGFLIALSFSACTDFVDPAIPYSNFDTGVYLRTLSVTPNFNFFQLSSAKFTLMVEAVDVEDGKRVKEVDVFVRRRRGAALSPEVKVTNVQASAFVPHTVKLADVHPESGSKYPAATIDVTLTQALQAMNFTLADINGGDFFEFRLVLTAIDGRQYTNSNLSGDVAGGAYYRSPFFYRIPVVCPSALAGTYDYVQTDMFCGGGRVASGKVTWTAVAGTTTYTSNNWDFGSWVACYGSGTAGGTLRLSDACGIISVTGQDQYGDTYRYLIQEVAGSKLTIKWDNTYGEFGTVVLTRPDGSSWPPLRN
jgi:hypothetical protein